MHLKQLKLMLVLDPTGKKLCFKVSNWCIYISKISNCCTKKIQKKVCSRWSHTVPRACKVAFNILRWFEKSFPGGKWCSWRCKLRKLENLFQFWKKSNFFNLRHRAEQNYLQTFQMVNQKAQMHHQVPDSMV